jgi:hypothetical protein
MAHVFECRGTMTSAIIACAYLPSNAEQITTRLVAHPKTNSRLVILSASYKIYLRNKKGAVDLVADLWEHQSPIGRILSSAVIG